MNKPNTFRELIDAWGGVPAFADDLDIPYVSAQGMYRRNSVAAWYWPKLLQLAAGKGVLVTGDRLIAMKPDRQTKPKAERASA